MGFANIGRSSNGRTGPFEGSNRGSIPCLPVFSGNMKSKNLEQILTRRKEVEMELLEYLKKTESDFDLDDIKTVIYNEESSDDLTDIVAMFDTGDMEMMGAVLEVINDAWNYFPHKILDGLSPAEMILRHQKKGGGQNSAMPQSISITVQYDEELQKITNIKEHPVILSDGATFAYLLQNIFMAYPDIEKNYPPGMLGFSINGFAPKAYSPLLDGDLVSLITGKLTDK